MTNEQRAYLSRIGEKLSPTQLQAVETLMNHGGSMGADALAIAVGVPGFRINGFLALLQERLNADGDDVLLYDPSAREIRLELGRTHSASLRAHASVPSAPLGTAAQAEGVSQMAIQTPLESLIEFADNPDPRVPCVLVLDTSASMHGHPIDELNEGLASFRDSIGKDVLARRRVEPAVIAFNDFATLVRDFVTADVFDPPLLEAGGQTNMGAAIDLAMTTLESRKLVYKQAGIAYYRPWFILITDGAPTDGSDVARSRELLRAAEDSKKLFSLIIGVGGADMEFLRTLSSRPPLKMKGLAFAEFFRWLSSSMQTVSGSRPGDKADLQPPTSWSIET